MSVASVLVVQHEDSCPPGHLTSWAREAGVHLDVRRCHAGEALPSTLVDHCGLILLGGEMGAYDDARFPWLTDAKRLVVEAVDASVPLLSICLGHQLAAVALGGRVARRAIGAARGVLPVGLVPGAEHDRLAAALRPGARVLHWNSDTVASEPEGATVLARDADGEVQLVRFAPLAWGVQGHPEADVAIVTAWGQSEATGQPADVEAGGEAVPAPLAVVAQLSAEHARLVATWAPVAGAFFAAAASGSTAGSANPADRPSIAR